MATSASKCPNYGSYETIECEETAQTQTELIVRAKRTPFWGRYHTFLFRNGEPLIAFGPHWPLFVLAYCGFWTLCVLMLHAGEQQVNLSSRHYQLILGVCFIQLVSYLLVSMKNPGIANREIVLTEESIEQMPDKPRRGCIWYCRKCDLIQPPGTGHCEFCNICIYEHDHHCPWTGKCIGKYNFIEFIVFVSSTFLLLLTFIMSTIQQQ